MNRRAMWAIVRKDLTVIRRTKALLAPLVAVPVLLLVVLPIALALVPQLGGVAQTARLREMLTQLPPELRATYAGLTPAQTWIAVLNMNLLAPLYLLVPFMVANVIAADSFAGERERKTLEALLHTPTTDAELFLAKVLAAWLPAVAVGAAGFVIYSVVVNAAAWPVMERIFFPNVTWVLLAAWLAPAVAAFGLAGMVIVSLRVNGTQEAVQLGGLFIIPLVALIGSQLKGIILFGPGAVTIAGVAIWLLDALLLVYGARSFRRTKLIARL